MSAVDVLAVMDRADAHYAGWDISAADKAVLDDLNEARAAVAELIEADEEYEAARRDWDIVTNLPPEDTADETWRRVSDRFEVAVMRRAAALARCKGAQA